MKDLFLKYFAKEKKENIFHSSEYGKAQNANAMGAASVETFSERMETERNRQIVKSYGESRIANGMYGNGPRAKRYVPPESTQKNVSTGRSAEKFGANKSSAKPAPAAPAPKRSFAPPIKPNFGK